MMHRSTGRGEIFVESIVHGGVAKVTAIDSISGTEACVLGPATTSRAVLEALAVRKLDYVMKKQLGEK